MLWSFCVSPRFQVSVAAREFLKPQELSECLCSFILMEHHLAVWEPDVGGDINRASQELVKYSVNTMEK